MTPAAVIWLVVFAIGVVAVDYQKLGEYGEKWRSLKCVPEEQCNDTYGKETPIREASVRFLARIRCGWFEGIKPMIWCHDKPEIEPCVPIQMCSSISRRVSKWKSLTPQAKVYLESLTCTVPKNASKLMVHCPNQSSKKVHRRKQLPKIAQCVADSKCMTYISVGEKTKVPPLLRPRPEIVCGHTKKQEVKVWCTQVDPRYVI